MKYLLIITLSTILLSCSSNKNSNSSTGGSNSTGSNNSSTSQTRESMPEEGKYHLFVSFYSRGEGIDNEVRDEYAAFLKKQDKNIVAEEVRWGREGEVDYCIRLDKLSPQKRAEFMSESGKILAKSERVHVKENSECVHKRTD